MMGFICRQFSARPPAINVTSAAAQQLKSLLVSKSPQTIGVKVGIKKRGCNGLTYTMDFTQSAGKYDQVIDIEGIKIVIDAKAVMFILGTKIDYINTGINEEFTFDNPNSKGSCGCGESFTV